MITLYARLVQLRRDSIARDVGYFVSEVGNKFDWGFSEHLNAIATSNRINLVWLRTAIESLISDIQALSHADGIMQEPPASKLPLCLSDAWACDALSFECTCKQMAMYLAVQ